MMVIDLAIFIVLYLLGFLVFGHFERYAGLPRRIGKIVVLVGITALISATAGRPWSLIWDFGIMGVGLTFHFWWALAHGIHPITAEPKAKYYALRGWSEKL
jgi:hypothetical protein